MKFILIQIRRLVISMTFIVFDTQSCIIKFRGTKAIESSSKQQLFQKANVLLDRQDGLTPSIISLVHQILGPFLPGGHCGSPYIYNVPSA